MEGFVMSAKRAFRRVDIDTAVKKMLNAPKIPEEKRALSREEALKLLTDGFRHLFNQGYSIKEIVEYAMQSGCPIKDIKQGEIARLLQLEEKNPPSKRKHRRLTTKTEAGNIPELITTKPSEPPPKVDKINMTQRDDRKGKEDPKEEMDILDFDKGSFSLNKDLPLDQI